MQVCTAEDNCGPAGHASGSIPLAAESLDTSFRSSTTPNTATLYPSGGGEGFYINLAISLVCFIFIDIFIGTTYDAHGSLDRVI